MDKVKYSSGYAELNKSAELIDRKHSESYDKLTRLLKAEITTRESQDQAVSTKADELNHKLGVAIKTMQTTISSLEMKYKELKDDVSLEQVLFPKKHKINRISTLCLNSLMPNNNCVVLGHI